MSPTYLDCEIRLGSGTGRAELKFDGAQYEGDPRLNAEARSELLSLTGSPERYGRKLFRAVFPEGSDLLSGYRQALALARHQERKLRLRLLIPQTARELHSLPWERLYDPYNRLALGRSREVVLSRYASLDRRAPTSIEGRPKLLVAVACPPAVEQYGLDPFDVEESVEQIKTALSALENRLDCEFLEGPVTAKILDDRLQEGGFHALHLQAHGLLRPDHGIAEVVLDGKDGEADFVDESKFGELADGLQGLRLVTLVACHGGSASRESDPFSGLGPALLYRGVPAVVAMRQTITLSLAHQFTANFYQALALSGTIDQAANEARHDMKLEGSADWHVPVLFMRLGDGQLWKAQEDAVAAVLPAASTGGASFRALVERIDSDNCVPFLGPGLYQGLLPTSHELAQRWADDYQPYPLQVDLPTVAQFIEAREVQGFPHDLLPRYLIADLLAREGVKERKHLRKSSLSEVIGRIAERHFDRDSDEPHRLLAELGLSHYVTTNFDSFMTSALSWVDRKPQRRRCLWRSNLSEREEIEEYGALHGTVENPLVFHLFGNDEAPTAYVLTADDHLDFLYALGRDSWRLPGRIRSKLTESMLILLGYDLRDLGCRVLLRGIVAQIRDLRRGRVAVLQIDPGRLRGRERQEALKNLQVFHENSCKELQIQVFWGTVRQFLSQLRRHRQENDERTAAS